MFLSAVLTLPVLAVSSKVQQTSGQAGRQGSDTGSRGSCSVIEIGLDCIVHHLPLSSPHPSNTKLVDPQCCYALTSLTVPCPCPHSRNSLSNLCVVTDHWSATNSALPLLGQISAYPARAWIRCVITGRCVWSRMMSQCASAPRLARRHLIRCAGPTATATAVPARCEPWAAPCRSPFTSNTKDPAVSTVNTHCSVYRRTKIYILEFI